MNRKCKRWKKINTILVYPLVQYIFSVFLIIFPAFMGVIFVEGFPGVGDWKDSLKVILWSILLVTSCVVSCLVKHNYIVSAKERFKEKAAQNAYSVAYKLVEEKRNQYIRKIQRKEEHNPTDTPEDNIEFMQRIGRNVEELIASITSQNRHYFSTGIIYREGKDGQWKWVLRNDLSSRVDLQDFVEKNEDTVYHQLEKRHFVFYNDKIEAANEGKYRMGYRDMVHNRIGSILGMKIILSDFSNQLYECRIAISTHGVKFTDDIELNTDELEQLILYEIFPYYQKLFETELARLWLRKQKDKTA